MTNSWSFWLVLVVGYLAVALCVCEVHVVIAGRWRAWRECRKLLRRSAMPTETWAREVAREQRRGELSVDR